jgi:hypothetical protein
MTTTHLRALSIAALFVVGTLGVRASTTSSPSPVSTPSALQQEVPPKLDEAFTAVENALRKTLDVAPALSPGRADLLLLMRKHPRASRSWQLAPALARELNDDELFRYVTQRANAVLLCGTSYLSRSSLQQVQAARESGKQTDQTSEAARLWKGPPQEGTMRFTPDCVQLIDPDDQPVTMSTRDDLAAFSRLFARFQPPPPETGRAQAASSRMDENLAYIRREYGGAPSRDAEIEKALGRNGAQVFSRQVLTFQAFMRVTGAEHTLILLVPLSS